MLNLMVFRELEKAEPFTRKIHEDELWLYRNPRTESFVPTTILWVDIYLEILYNNNVCFLANNIY